ncbi:MAG: hypothetical protein U1G05_18215 [Kiritimatiellia bacterium]
MQSSGRLVCRMSWTSSPRWSSAGPLLTGRVGFLPGTLMGVLILGLIQTLITFQGDLNTWWTKIAVGVLLLLFIVLQKVIAGRARRG